MGLGRSLAIALAGFGMLFPVTAIALTKTQQATLYERIRAAALFDSTSRDTLSLPDPSEPDYKLAVLINGFGAFASQNAMALSDFERPRRSWQAVSALRRRHNDYLKAEKALRNAQLMVDKNRKQRFDATLSIASVHRDSMSAWLRAITLPRPSRWLPVSLLSTEQSVAFWGAEDEHEWLPSASLIGSDGSGTLTAVIARDYYFGLRTLFATAVSSGSGEDVIRPNAQKLLEAGGNLSLTLEYPLAAFRRGDETQAVPSTVGQGSFGEFMLSVDPRGGAGSRRRARLNQSQPTAAILGCRLRRVSLQRIDP